MRYTRAVVGWMQAQGVPTVEYLDDFFCVADTKGEAEEILMMLVEFVTLLGFKVNNAKCEGPGRRMEFLGVILSTEGERCTEEISEERIAFVLRQAKEVEEQATQGAVRRKLLESLLGLLAFCGQVVWGLSLYTRRGFALLTASGRRPWVQLSLAVSEDIRVLERVIRLYNGRKVVLFREDVKKDWFATDASGTKGMGGLLDESYFLYSWDDVRRMVVVIRIDNQCALRQVDKLWGPVDYLPLLDQIFYLCARWDVRLRPVYINTKDNLLADLLSRLDLRQFHLEHRAFMRASIWRQDRDDWMLHTSLWHELDLEFGPFTLDSCVVVSRANAVCVLSWSKEEDARVQAFDGHNAWGNLPFSIMLDILRNFIRCKRRQQMGTAGTFLVPVWDGNEAWELVKALPDVFKVVRRWRSGTHLFTAPALQGGGRCAGAEEVLEALQQEAQRYEGAALSDNTKGSYNTGARSFITFCIYFSCLGCMAPLLPATDETLIFFITFSSWFVAPDIIKSYMAGVRQLHLQRGFEWRPVAQRHRVAATLQGVRRFWGKPSKPVMPLTLQNLADMAKCIDLQDVTSLSLWAAILVGFFGLFRKDNLTEGKAGAWNSRASLVRDDVIFTEDGEAVWLRVRYSKTIQCGERCHKAPLRRVPGSALCPVAALWTLMAATAGRAGDSALFVMEKVSGRKAQLVPLGHGDLVKGIKALGSAVGLDPDGYAGHSLRRGGATAALRLDVSSVYIKM
ncbi:hypothetical protein CYMTET_35194 [Cymbomonas tetramitiformis]|uniref:Reverse transcriptase domain-containing protein n=1 Tax=Cymbomonas tetramitiformis TaxID=36881 RepID=A0AAE0F9P0_9CHLO|nr:hypothetical protein CYMTET_35194 [Cymbomonas tetramitiformis]